MGNEGFGRGPLAGGRSPWRSSGNGAGGTVYGGGCKYTVEAIVGHRAQPCRAGTASCRGVACLTVLGQAFGPRHGTWAVYPCRAAHGPQSFLSCRVGPWHDSHGTPEEEGRAERR
jgi:hypothetical protein